MYLYLVVGIWDRQTLTLKKKKGIVLAREHEMYIYEYKGYAAPLFALAGECRVMTNEWVMTSVQLQRTPTPPTWPHSTDTGLVQFISILWYNLQIYIFFLVKVQFANIILQKKNIFF